MLIINRERKIEMINKSKKFKRCLAMFSAVIMLMYSIEDSIVAVKACEDITYVENEVDDQNYSNINEIKDEFEFIGDKIDEEIENDSGVFENDKIEKILNENGVFDEDIQSIYNEEEISELNEIDQDDIDNMSVYVEYYAVPDMDITEESENLDNYEMIRLTDEQVDMYMAEKYFEVNTELDEQIQEKIEEDYDEQREGDSISDKVLTAIGVKPITVYAETQEKQGTCMLKKIVSCSKNPKSDYVTVEAIAIWDTMPVMREFDMIELNFAGLAKYEPDAAGSNNEIEVKHFWNEKIWYGAADKLQFIDNSRVVGKMHNTTNQVLKDGEFNCYKGDIQIAFKLHKDENEIDYKGNVYKTDVKKEGVKCKTHVRLNTQEKKKLFIELNYFHKVETIDVVGGILSLTSGGGFNAIFVLANDNRKQYKVVESGVKKPFEFKFK